MSILVNGGTTLLENVITAVCQELSRQRQKWGEQNHKPEEWLMILGEEVGEANKAALEAHFKKKYHEQHKDGATIQDYRKELIQVAAVAISAIESFDRRTT